MLSSLVKYALNDLRAYFGIVPAIFTGADRLNINKESGQMNKNQLNTALAAILTTAVETEPEPFPESFAYLALGSDIHKWETVKHVLSFSGLATFTGSLVKLTDRGRLMAEKCNEFAGKAA